MDPKCINWTLTGPIANLNVGLFESNWFTGASDQTDDFEGFLE